MTQIQDVPTHKIVNGKCVDLTEEEKKVIQAEWDANYADLQQKESARLAEVALKTSACNKLKLLGLTEAEIKVLLS